MKIPLNFIEQYFTKKTTGGTDLQNLWGAELLGWALVLHFMGISLSWRKTICYKDRRAHLLYRLHRRPEQGIGLAQEGIGTLQQH